MVCFYNADLGSSKGGPSRNFFGDGQLGKTVPPPGTTPSPDTTLLLLHPQHDPRLRGLSKNRLLYAIDFSGNGNNGVLNGNANISTTGIIGNAVSLDGSSGYVSLPAGLLNNLSDFTISA